MSKPQESPHWTENDSSDFIEFGDHIVPERKVQLEIFGQLLAASNKQQSVLEVCCGAGQLGQALLRRFPALNYIGLDGSEVMLEATEKRIKSLDACTLQVFRLEDPGWRKQWQDLDAVFSSLAIHHLDAAGKQQLFRDVWHMLRPGGVFAILDIIAPGNPAGVSIAASAWDDWVRASSGGENSPVFRKFRDEGWNYFSDSEPDPYDQPDALPDQLTWLKEAGFEQVDVYWMKAGHALFGGWKR